MSTIYSDFDISFGKDPLSGDLMIVEDEAAVSQSVRLLVLTSLYERPFQPGLGSTINHLLFEPLTSITKSVLAQTIKSVIDQYEPRATLKYVDIYTDIGPNGQQLDGHTLLVGVGFYVYNRPSLVTTTLVLRRLR